MHTLKIILNVVFSACGVVAILWLFYSAFRRSGNRAALVLRWTVTAVALYFEITVAVPGFARGGFDAVFGLIVTLLFGGVMAVLWTGSIVDMIARPVAALYDGGDEEVEPKPYYSIANGRRKANKPLEAIVAVREQLAKFPNDYEGIILLAAIEAEDMKDLPSAEMTLNHFCEWEKAPPKQVAAALTQLADWHLKLANDVNSARATLERIVEKFPDTELSTAAAQRLAHLGGTDAILAAARDRRPVFVPEGVKNAGLRDTILDLVPGETNPEKLAAEFVKHLEQHPLDAEAREKLAIIYARHYQRLDLAADEFRQLIQQHEQSPKRVAHWLNLFADLQIRAGADYETVRPTLEKIIERFPDLPVADLARSRLNLLKLEIKGQQKEPAHKVLGEYEQNIGLKYGPTYGSSRHL